jgi:DNA-directed RNA polymerase specialized sigma54-like protein
MMRWGGTEADKRISENRFDSPWFLNSIVSRRETMLKVMNAIIDRQKEFFDKRRKP